MKNLKLTLSIFTDASDKILILTSSINKSEKGVRFLFYILVYKKLVP